MSSNGRTLAFGAKNVGSTPAEEAIMFTLDKEQLEAFGKWDDDHYPKCRYYKNSGTIGGRLTYSFTPTSIGVVVKVKCSCGVEIDLSDYKNW